MCARMRRCFSLILTGKRVLAFYRRSGSISWSSTSYIKRSILLRPETPGHEFQTLAKVKAILGTKWQLDIAP
jgi:hypothetical protein